MHHFAMLEQDLICHPIRNVIHPNGARIQKKDRNPEDEKQDSFADLKKRDQLEITNAVLRPQNLEVSRGMRHPQSSPDLLHSATTALPRQQIYSLFPSGSSKNNA